MAIAYAAKTLIRGKNDFILAGGMEAPVTPYALLCCNTSGMLTHRNDTPQTAYRPFDKTRDGFAIAEGAGVVILERQERVKKRNAHVYANIIGYGTTTDGFDRIDRIHINTDSSRICFKWHCTLRTSLRIINSGKI
jgi:3-oxoacyl-[acyl-carrier-protein] synthase II